MRKSLPLILALAVFACKTATAQSPLTVEQYRLMLQGIYENETGKAIFGDAALFEDTEGSQDPGNDYRVEPLTPSDAFLFPINVISFGEGRWSRKQSATGLSGRLTAPTFWQVEFTAEGLHIVEIMSDEGADIHPNFGKDFTVRLTDNGTRGKVAGRWPLMSTYPLTQAMLEFYPRHLLPLMREELLARQKASGKPLTATEKANLALVKKLEARQAAAPECMVSRLSYRHWYVDEEGLHPTAYLEIPDGEKRAFVGADCPGEVVETTLNTLERIRLTEALRQGRLYALQPSYQAPSETPDYQDYWTLEAAFTDGSSFASSGQNCTPPHASFRPLTELLPGLRRGQMAPGHLKGVTLMSAERQQLCCTDGIATDTLGTTAPPFRVYQLSANSGHQLVVFPDTLKPDSARMRVYKGEGKYKRLNEDHFYLLMGDYTDEEGHKGSISEFGKLNLPGVKPGSRLSFYLNGEGRPTLFVKAYDPKDKEQFAIYRMKLTEQGFNLYTTAKNEAGLYVADRLLHRFTKTTSGSKLTSTLWHVTNEVALTRNLLCHFPKRGLEALKTDILARYSPGQRISDIERLNLRIIDRWLPTAPDETPEYE